MPDTPFIEPWNKTLNTPDILGLKEVHYEVPSDNGHLTILKNVNLTVQPKETLAVVGRSGSGKSTLLALMAGLDVPSNGQIHLFGQSLLGLNEDARARIRAKEVGFVFQNFQLIPSMTALENVLMPLELFQIDAAMERAHQALGQVGLSHRLHHRPGELSGGEQQRVAIARALVTQPKILFADEPTGNLDENTAEDIQSLLFDLNTDQNTTLIIVTHDLELAKRCQRQVMIEHGQLVEKAAHAIS